MKIDEKLEVLRQSMHSHNIDAYIIPTSDPHQSEYVADCWQSRKWISGFTGSAGIATVTQDHAGIWTDSRYFIQAEKELSGTGFELCKVIQQFSPIHVAFLKEQLSSGATVGIDGWLFSKSQVDHLTKEFKQVDIKLISNINLINEVWTDRPTLPTDSIFIHDIKFAGKTRSEKIKDVRKVMSEDSLDHHLINTLDDIAWLFNLRGSDVPCNPVAVCYALISKDTSILFINPAKVSNNVRKSLEEDNIQISPYEDVQKQLNELPVQDSIHIDQYSCNDVLYRSINAQNIVHGRPITQKMKAIKNKVELDHFRQVMVKDGVALTRFFIWLENELQSTSVSEHFAAVRLAEFRAAQSEYKGESFDAIVGFERNGAIVHYRAKEDDCADIHNQGMLLLDSGGQYLDGTTDITRTVHFGNPSEEQKTNYTLVLKGHIGLAKAKFPVGTLGVQLDMLARQHLWRHGLNYSHGTGHGVGFFLNVHESPQGFSPGISSRSKCAFEPGMVTSNEPGYYKTGGYGIRIENLVITVESQDEGFLEHETITLFPIDTKLIDKQIMTGGEISWLNQYHEEVYSKLSAHLNDTEKQWLQQKCASI